MWLEASLVFVFGVLFGWILRGRAESATFNRLATLLVATQGEKSELLDRVQSVLFRGSLHELREPSADERPRVSPATADLLAMYDPTD